MNDLSQEKKAEIAQEVSISILQELGKKNIHPAIGLAGLMLCIDTICHMGNVDMKEIFEGWTHDNPSSGHCVPL